MENVVWVTVGKGTSNERQVTEVNGYHLEVYEAEPDPSDPLEDGEEAWVWQATKPGEAPFDGEAGSEEAAKEAAIEYASPAAVAPPKSEGPAFCSGCGQPLAEKDRHWGMCPPCWNKQF